MQIGIIQRYVVDVANCGCSVTVIFRVKDSSATIGTSYSSCHPSRGRNLRS